MQHTKDDATVNDLLEILLKAKADGYGDYIVTFYNGDYYAQNEPATINEELKEVDLVGSP